MYPVFFQMPQWVPFLGGQPITSFGVFMLLAFLTAGYVLRAELQRVNEDPDKAWDFVFMAVIGGILGAKVYYLLLNFPSLIEDPIRMIFSRGGLVWYGGFLLATALVIREIRRQGLSVPAMADLIAPALALAYAVGRIGCFLVGENGIGERYCIDGALFDIRLHLREFRSAIGFRLEALLAHIVCRADLDHLGIGGDGADHDCCPGLDQRAARGDANQTCKNAVGHCTEVHHAHGDSR